MSKRAPSSYGYITLILITPFLLSYPVYVPPRDARPSCAPNSTIDQPMRSRMKRIPLTEFCAVAVLLAAAAALMSQEQNRTRRIPQFENDDVKVWKGIVYP